MACSVATGPEAGAQAVGTDRLAVDCHNGGPAAASGGRTPPAFPKEPAGPMTRSDPSRSPGRRPARRTAVSRTARRSVLVSALALAALSAACGRNEADGSSVSLDVARAEHDAGRALLIDIREPAEHARGVVPGAGLLPMKQLAARLAEIPTDPTRPVLLICATQSRSRATTGLLRERGYAHVRYVHGGMTEWARRGWPMVAPPR
jgi:rhodanese-related sulfurtransferase